MEPLMLTKTSLCFMVTGQTQQAPFRPSCYLHMAILRKHSKNLLKEKGKPQVPERKRKSKIKVTAEAGAVADARRTAC